MSREEIIRALALRYIVPLTLEPQTPYEINAVKNLERFGKDVIDAVIASNPKSQFLIGTTARTADSELIEGLTEK